MLKNYFLVAVRNLLNNRWISLISLTGLTLGLSVFALISIHIYNDLRYDEFHPNADRLFRVAIDYRQEQTVQSITLTSAPMGPALKEDFPEVSEFIRIRKVYRGFPAVRYGEVSFYEEQFFAVDSSFLEAFGFQLLKGDPATALKEPYSIVLTEEMAKKYFGDTDPLGEILTVDKVDSYKVTGILKNLPSYSHLNFLDFIVSFSTLTTMKNKGLDNWMALGLRTYLLLEKNASATSLESKLPQFVDTRIGKELKESGIEYKLFLQPIPQIHLKSNLLYEFQPGGSIERLKVLSSIAILILLLSCFNYINLTTARSSLRRREVGVRKIFGAQRTQLIGQFTGEAALLTLIAMVIAVCASWFFFPQFNTFMGKSVTIDQSGLVFGGVTILIGYLIITLIAGLLPAFLLSKQQSVAALGRNMVQEIKGIKLRHFLATTQLIISSSLIIGTLCIIHQIDFLKNKNLGFSQDQVIIVPCQGSTTRSFKIMKSKLLENPAVAAVSVVSNTPGEPFAQAPFIPEGADPEKESLTLFSTYVDDSFLETLGLSLHSGRDFSEDFPADTLGEAFMINEAALQALSWEDPIGKKATFSNNKVGYLVGVVKNFNFNSLHEEIEPLVLRIVPGAYRAVMIRLKPESNISTSLLSVRSTWKETMGDSPFDFTFLDSQIENLYQSETRFAAIANFLTIVTLFISAIGLFGLATFIILRQYKQIAIRKVLGAPILNLLVLLSKEFLIITLLALMVSVPVTYYFINRWSESFAYKTQFGIEIFVIGSLITLLLPIVSVGYQSLRAAVKNPVDALREE